MQSGNAEQSLATDQVPSSEGFGHPGTTGAQLPIPDDSFLDDFDFCPTLEELLQDPLLEMEWPRMETEIAPGERPHQEDSSCHSILQVAQDSSGMRRQCTEAQRGSSVPNTSTSEACTQEDISSENSNVPRDGSPEGSSPEEEQENKRMRRMQRNRESASLSRERRKIQMADKDKQMADLQAMYSSISVLANKLGQENGVLRQELIRICQQFGQPLPQILLSCPPMLARPGECALPPGHIATSHNLPVQKVAIQKIPVSRPTPAVPASKAGNRAPKRRKQQAIAGGTTVMAALFCFMFFWSPLTPSFRLAGQSGATLPATDQAMQVHGRVLQSVSQEEEVTSKWTEPQDSNNTHSILVQPADLETESKALQRLKEIGPVAVFSKYDTDAGKFSPPAPWKSLASLADTALARDGITKSSQCEKVFSLDISAVEDHEAAQKQLQQYMAQATSFKGRYQTLALPAAGRSVPALEVEGSSDQNAKISCSDSSGDDYIISVMVPTKEQLDGYTSISKMYIVVLNPNKRYTTYACSLNRPVMI